MTDDQPTEGPDLATAPAVRTDPVAADDGIAPGGTRTAEATSWWLPWLAATRTAGPIWAVFTLLRYVVSAIVEYVAQPDHGRLAQGVVGVLKLPFAFDAAFFTEIAANGYFGQRTAPEWRAFFPGYPLAMRGASLALTFDVTSGRLMVAGALLSAACSLIAAIVIFRLASSVGGPRAGTCAALLLMLWPSATFLTAAYSESMYLALAVGAWWNALKGRWWVAGLLCAAASFTRINGVFLAAALLVLLLVRATRRRERFRWHHLVAVAVGGSGAALYLGYLWVRTGDPGAWQAAQLKGWGRETVGPWVSLVNTIDGLAASDDRPRQLQWIIDIAVVGFCALAALYMALRRYWPELTLLLLTVGVLASSYNYMSIMRNTLTIFPLFVIGGGILARRREWFTAMVLTLSGVWMVGTTVLFTLMKWAG